MVTHIIPSDHFPLIKCVNTPQSRLAFRELAPSMRFRPRINDRWSVSASRSVWTSYIYDSRAATISVTDRHQILCARRGSSSHWKHSRSRARTANASRRRKYVKWTLTHAQYCSRAILHIFRHLYTRRISICVWVVFGYSIHTHTNYERWDLRLSGMRSAGALRVFTGGIADRKLIRVFMNMETMGAHTQRMRASEHASPQTRRVEYLFVHFVCSSRIRWIRVRVNACFET